MVSNKNVAEVSRMGSMSNSSQRQRSHQYYEYVALQDGHFELIHTLERQGTVSNVHIVTSKTEIDALALVNIQAELESRTSVKLMYREPIQGHSFIEEC